MEIFAGLSVALLILSSLVIAIKTLALWRRTRGLPELLLGLMLLSATVMGYPLTITSTLIPMTEMWPIHASAQVFMAVGYACLLLFTRQVFRAGTLWATWLAALTMGVIVLGTGLYVSEVTGESPRRPIEMLSVTMLNCAPIAVAYFWTTTEALVYYRQMRLRLRLGLTDVVVANRVLLWGLMTLSAGVAVVVNAVAMLMGFFLTPPIVAVSSLLGLVHAACLFLAFHPPAWYRDWLAPGSAVHAG